MMNWRSVEDDPPRMGKLVIVSDGKISFEVYRSIKNEYIRYGSYDVADVGMKPIKWCEMPIWEGEDENN